MSQDADQSRGFDFEVGEWRVKHRRLKQRLKNADDWEVFEGRSSMRLILDGLGNIEDNIIDLPGNCYRAAALRSFDKASGQWAIWWLDSRAPHHLDVPLIGRFENGVGSFYADDTFEGRPIRVRFTWSETDTDSPKWEQAFSADGGLSWETNWEMRFLRP